ncbi:polysaccharide pyruvyl transferase family protein [Halopseudomonas salina]|uniref:Polysaccharide pyruvyl transferase domain-containing protein n=1 Tax=Halopseudomonas salina TaxID=1323744 RepID=A0ABQ1PPV7_9GAMM|nr:polysaccharide pyruvyl transferase family protein [Halopseudomonas salina]GGD00797.1 hypothetical protein GCM10007418_20060 [Halopseudomonas salina]
MDIRVLEFTSPVFERFFNLGDDIQSLAVSRLLPKVDGYVCREALNHVDTECVVPMNGFFMNTDNWPPSAKVYPVFFAFHVRPESQKHIFTPAGIDYLKKWAPIGCRDQGTLALMQAHGIDAYYSKCVTLTLPRRETTPENGQVFLAGLSDTAKHALPRSLRKEAIVVDQAKIRLPITDSKLKLMLAEELLKQYRDRARLVVTSKIHCAMPCIAMGIPVVFLYDKNKQDDYRVKIINDLVGINYVYEHGPAARIRNHALSNRIDWSPAPLNIEEMKDDIRQKFAVAFQRVTSVG